MGYNSGNTKSNLEGRPASKMEERVISKVDAPSQPKPPKVRRINVLTGRGKLRQVYIKFGLSGSKLYFQYHRSRAYRWFTNKILTMEASKENSDMIVHLIKIDKPSFLFLYETMQDEEKTKIFLDIMRN